jgi:phage-related tail protein
VAPDRLGDVWEQLDRAQRHNTDKEEELQRVHRALQHQIRLLGQHQRKLKDTEQKWKTATETATAHHLQTIRTLESKLQRCKAENSVKQA